MQIEPRLAGGNADRETTHKESLHYFPAITLIPANVANAAAIRDAMVVMSSVLTHPWPPPVIEG